MTNVGAGRVRLLVRAACAALILVGLSAVLWALVHQTGPPPAPATSVALPSPTPIATPPPSASAAPVVPALAASAPVRIRIDSIDVDSPLHALGLNSDRSLQVPSGQRYDEAAWYEGSPTPGQVGPAVVEGHVTGSGGVASVFYELGDVDPGDRVEVDREDGRTAIFAMDRIAQYPKAELPKIAVFGNSDRPELRLITCGGSYDPQTRRHQDNVVVYAHLIYSR